MSEPASEMPISDAREHLADVVNRAVYGGEATYLTRRGRRLALVVSAGQLAADRARAQEQAVVEACSQMWETVSGESEATRAAVRSVIDPPLPLVEHPPDPPSATVPAHDPPTRPHALPR